MQIKIFSGEKAIHITDQLTDKLRFLSTKRDLLFFDEQDKIDARLLTEQLATPKLTAALIVRKDLTTIRRDFFNQFENIAAAGGLVQNSDKDILFIYRMGKWDLPKGKMEQGENQEQCAAREITEETGVKDLTLHSKICDTYHIYKENGRHILKTCHWFYFTCGDSQQLIPQRTEDITEVTWVKSSNLKQPMENTYQNIKDVVHAFIDTP